MAAGREGLDIGRLAEIRRFPVKSMRGEVLPQGKLVADRGLQGDRLWALQTPEGKLGSGKTTRRFQRVPGLLEFQARYEDDAPIITCPDGREIQGDSEDAHAALSALLAQPLRLVREGDVSHFDEAPLSLLTTASLRSLQRIMGDPVDPQRFRANLLIDTDQEGFPEDDWAGRRLRIGPSVVIRVLAPITRCLMVGLPQGDLPADPRILRSLASAHGAQCAASVCVEVGGWVETGDRILLD